MRNRYLLCAGISIRAVAPMPRSWRLAAALLSSFVMVSARLEVYLLQCWFGLLGALLTQQTAQAIERCLLFLQQLGRTSECVNRCQQLAISLFRQRFLPGSLQQGLQLFNRNVNGLDRRRHGIHWFNNSRKRGVNGSPNTSFTGNLGFLLGAFLPRPVVRPSTIQFAAR
jgi:hypothetical protein